MDKGKILKVVLSVLTVQFSKRIDWEIDKNDNCTGLPSVTADVSVY